MRVSVSTSIINSRNLDSINDALAAGVSKAAMLVQGSAKNKAPVDSGALRQSIRADKAKIQGENVTATVSTNLEYAPYVEFGTGPKGQANHSGISPEVSVSYRSTPWYVHEDQIDVGPYHFQKMGEFYKMYGQPAQPFLYPALKDNHDRISNNISKYVSRKIREQIR